MRILVLYYSQSGDVTRAARAFVEPLEAAGATVLWEQLRPKVPYPFPWKSVARFFDVLPECVLEDPPEIESPAFDQSQKFDLVILAYQVWFLSPSLPMQALFRTPQASVLRGTKCLTLTVCRNMWHSAFKIMRRLIHAAGGQLADNIVVTHQGPVWQTFITTTRTLLFGKRERSTGQPARTGVAESEFERLARLGTCAAARLEVADRSRRSLLHGENIVQIDRLYVIPELFGRCLFTLGARAARLLGRASPRFRQVGLYGLVFLLAASILLLIPLQMILLVCFYPLLRRWLAAYALDLSRLVPSARPGETVRFVGRTPSKSQHGWRLPASD